MIFVRKGEVATNDLYTSNGALAAEDRAVDDALLLRTVAPPRTTKGLDRKGLDLKGLDMECLLRWAGSAA